MSQRCSRTSNASRHATGLASTGRSRQCIAACIAVLLAWSVAGCSSLPKSQKCVMPADEHSYGPLTPFGHYETHWNTWPTECDDEDETPTKDAAAPKDAGSSTDTLTLSEPDSGVAPSPGGDSTTDPLEGLLLPAPADNNSKATPMPDAPPTAPPGGLPGGATAPDTQPNNPLGTPPGGTLPEIPPDGSDLPKSTLPSLPDTDALKPAGDLLPESLLPKDEPLPMPKSDENEKKKAKAVEPPKQSRAPKSDPRGRRLSAAPARITPELAFPENRVRKASADVSTGSRPSTSSSGWRGKSAGATTQPEDSSGKWQGRRTMMPSINRQASHVQNVNRSASVERSSSVEPATAVEPIDSQRSTGNPLR